MHQTQIIDHHKVPMSPEYFMLNNKKILEKESQND